MLDEWIEQRIFPLNFIHPAIYLFILSMFECMKNKEQKLEAFGRLLQIMDE